MGRSKLRLTLQNFGPIVRGCVEFNPITVFIGPNKSGKTYTATLAYALLSMDEMRRQMFEYLNLVAWEQLRKERKQIIQLLKQAVGNKETLTDGSETARSSKAFIPFNRFISEFSEIVKGQAEKQAEKFLPERIETLFGCDIESLMRWSSRKCRIVLEENGARFEFSFTKRNRIFKAEVDFKTLFEKRLLDAASRAIQLLKRGPQLPKERLDRFLHQFYDDFVDSVLESILVGTPALLPGGRVRTLLIPAGRAGL